MTFDCFLGVDQTGAASQKGQTAKPLKGAILERAPERWEFRLVSMPSLSPSVVRSVLTDPKKFLRTAIVLDCVLGLPKPYIKDGKKLWRLFEEAFDWKCPSGNKFGRKASQSFFSRFENSKSNFRRRYVEVLANSNSVFQLHPFQKNIQTGTYRFWRDLASSNSEKRWAHLWPYELPSDTTVAKPWLFEGYPSFFWKYFLGLPKRELGKFKERIEKRARGKIEISTKIWETLATDPDAADAAILTLGAFWLWEEGRLFEPFYGFASSPYRLTEGWILGVVDLSARSS